jgi:hypothetical protein
VTDKSFSKGPQIMWLIDLEGSDNQLAIFGFEIIFSLCWVGQLFD